LEDSAASLAESSSRFGQAYEKSQRNKEAILQAQIALEQQKLDLQKCALLLDPKSSATEEEKCRVREKMISGLYQTAVIPSDSNEPENNYEQE
jgi:hypothetical protein